MESGTVHSFPLYPPHFEVVAFRGIGKGENLRTMTIHETSPKKDVRLVTVYSELPF